MALTAAMPGQLAGQAQQAARLLRAGGAVAATAATGGAGVPGVRVSAGAAGAVVLLFPGRADSAAGQPAMLAVSLRALETLDLFGVRPGSRRRGAG